MQMRRLIEARILPLVPERGHGVGDCFIETAVERAELVGRNGRAPLDGQIRDGLANVAIVMDYLIDRVSEAKEFCAVLRGGPTDVRVDG